MSNSRTALLLSIAALSSTVMLRLGQELFSSPTGATRAPVVTPRVPAQVEARVERAMVAPYTDRQGQRRLVVWGVVENGTTWAADNLQVTVVMRDSRDEAVGTIAGKPVALSLPAGGRAPFRLEGPAPNGWAGFSSSASGIAGDNVMSRLSVIGSEAFIDTDNGLHVRGLVRNESVWPTADVRVWAVLYDRQDRAMTARWAIVRGVFEPGAERPFDLGFGVVRNWSAFEAGATDLFE